MLVSLKEARRIERRIQDNIIADGMNPRATINIYVEGSIETAINVAMVKVENDVTNIVDAIQVRANIRRLIQIENEESGINDLISERDAAIKMLMIWKELKTNGADAKAPSIVQRIVEAKLNRVEKGGDAYYRSDSEEFTAISKDMYDFSVNKVCAEQEVIDKCDDDLAVLNAGSRIEISEMDLEFLRQNNII